LTLFTITIKARPADIWPWLVQIGYKRGGMYSYTWLEKLMGVPMSNVDRIIPEFQELKVGDVIAYGPQGPYLPVREVQPNHLLILGGYDPTSGGGTTTFALDELDKEHTRLVMRCRTHWPNWTLRGILSNPPSGQRLRDLLLYLFFEPGQFIMMRKMLLGIKQRAEHVNRQTSESVHLSRVHPATSDRLVSPVPGGVALRFRPALVARLQRQKAINLISTEEVQDEFSEGKRRFGVLDAVRGGSALTRPSKGGTRNEEDR
jgi:hypothetical protein